MWREVFQNNIMIRSVFYFLLEIFNQKQIKKKRKRKTKQNKTKNKQKRCVN